MVFWCYQNNQKLHKDLSGNISALKLISLVFEVYIYVPASLVKHGGESIPASSSLQSSDPGCGIHLCKMSSPFG